MKFIDRVKKNKLLYFLGVLIVGIFIVLIVRFTYAYLAANVNEASGNVTVDSDETDNLKFAVGDPLSIVATSTTLPENGENLVDTTTSTATLLANSTNETAEYSYWVYFTISNNTFIYSDGSTPEIIFTVTDPTGNPVTNIDGLTYGTYNGVAGFDVTTANGVFAVASDYAITSSSSTTATEQTWNFTLTYLNQSYDQSANYGNSMTTEVSMMKEKLDNSLASYIKNLYTVDGENGLYYHDAGLANGAEDNSYRYSGANPNNYVCFGSDETTCPTDNLYRIIGVFDEQIKLIKYDYANSNLLGTNGDYTSWEYDSIWGPSRYYKGFLNQSTLYTYTWNNNTKVNIWSQSELNTINLNTNYWNYLNPTWQNLIAETTWYLGAMASSDNTAKAFYAGERNNAGYGSNPTTYTDEIGLMYPSDYGYAANPDAWATNLSSYDDSTITSNNWMYMGLKELTISSCLDDTDTVFGLSDPGGLFLSVVGDGVSSVIRPVFYLKSNVAYISGSGTQLDPYRIASAT